VSTDELRLRDSYTTVEPIELVLLRVQIESLVESDDGDWSSFSSVFQNDSIAQLPNKTNTVTAKIILNLIAKQLVRLLI